MGISIARLGDVSIGNCSDDDHDDSNPWSGSIITNSYDVNADGIGVARIGDIVLSNCGHTGVIVSGASTVYANSLPVAVLTSSFVGTYSGSIVGGSYDVFAT